MQNKYLHQLTTNLILIYTTTEIPIWTMNMIKSKGDATRCPSNEGLIGTIGDTTGTTFNGYEYSDTI